MMNVATFGPIALSMTGGAIQFSYKEGLGQPIDYTIERVRVWFGSRELFPDAPQWFMSGIVIVDDVSCDEQDFAMKHMSNVRREVYEGD